MRLRGKERARTGATHRPLACVSSPSLCTPPPPDRPPGQGETEVVQDGVLVNRGDGKVHSITRRGPPWMVRTSRTGHHHATRDVAATPHLSPTLKTWQTGKAGRNPTWSFVSGHVQTLLGSAESWGWIMGVRIDWAYFWTDGGSVGGWIFVLTQ